MAGFCEISRRSQVRFCELRGGIAKNLQPDPRNTPVFGRLALETRLENPLHGGPGIKPNGHLCFIQEGFWSDCVSEPCNLGRIAELGPIRAFPVWERMSVNRRMFAFAQGVGLRRHRDEKCGRKRSQGNSDNCVSITRNQRPERSLVLAPLWRKTLKRFQLRFGRQRSRCLSSCCCSIPFN
jgi:hypothetical protein